MLHLTFIKSLFNTEFPFTSLPVPDNVTKTPKGMVISNQRLRSYTGQISSFSKSFEIAIALAASITDPPPAAKMKSTFSFFMRSMPS